MNSREAKIEAFEAAWAAHLRETTQNSPPEINATLASVGSMASVVAPELACIDLEMRLRTGDTSERARVEWYVRQYPDVFSDSSVLLDLIRCEYFIRLRDELAFSLESCSRRRCPEEARAFLEEYRKRFPVAYAQIDSYGEYGVFSDHSSLRKWLIDKLKLEPGQLDKACGELSGPESLDAPPQALLRLLQATPAGWLRTRADLPALTRYQVDMIREGRGEELLLGSDFILLDYVGRGGMGTIYKARQIGVSRVVAIKMLLADGDINPHQEKRLQQEAADQASLDHPNIAPIYSFNRANGIAFFAMKFVEGENLAELVSRRYPEGVKVEQAVRWVAQAAEALSHAHERGVCHGDVTPSNIMVSKGGEVQVIDFGLARQFEDAAVAPLGGTAECMAPEQWAGAQLKPSSGPERQDIYNLGCTFYFLLTGKFPFQDAATPDPLPSELSHLACLPIARTAAAHRYCRPISPSVLRADMPRGLDWLITDKMLAKEPSARWSADQVSSALRPFLLRWRLILPISGWSFIAALLGGLLWNYFAWAAPAGGLRGLLWLVSSIAVGLIGVAGVQGALLWLVTFIAQRVVAVAEGRGWLSLAKTAGDLGERFAKWWDREAAVRAHARQCLMVWIALCASFGVFFALCAALGVPWTFASPSIGGTDKEPHQLAALMWPAVSMTPVIVTVVFLGGRYGLARVWDHTVPCLLFLAIMCGASVAFYDFSIGQSTGFRQHFDARGIPFVPKEILCAVLWAGLLTLPGFLILALFMGLGVRRREPVLADSQSRLGVLLADLALASVLAIGVVLLVLLFVLLVVLIFGGSQQFDSVRGLVAATSLRFCICGSLFVLLKGSRVDNTLVRRLLSVRAKKRT